MPLATQILRAGQPRSVRWGWFHVEAMVAVIRDELNLPAGADFLTVLTHCPHTAQRRHEFTDTSDGEVFVIEPGDRLDAWRE